MSVDALFLNGIYAEVLQNIYAYQQHLPELILYLQPYKNARIVELAECPPTPSSPVQLLASTTEDLSHVHWMGEIVGWEDKQKMSEERMRGVDDVISKLLPDEGGLYEEGTEGVTSLNLLHVRNIRPVKTPFSVALLIKDTDGEPVSPNRSTAGGWSYVGKKSEKWLSNYL